MALVLVVLLAAVLVGRLAGGDLDRLGRLPLRGKRLVVAGLLCQLAGTLVGGPAYALGLALSAALALGFLAVNRGARGTGLIGLGVVANALVVGLNGAMPVSLDAAGRAGIGLGAILLGDDPRHEIATEDTLLRWLADVVPVPLPWKPQVVSPGDVLVAAGLAQLVVVGMRGGGRARPDGGGPGAASLPDGGGPGAAGAASLPDGAAGSGAGPLPDSPAPRAPGSLPANAAHGVAGPLPDEPAVPERAQGRPEAGRPSRDGAGAG